MDRDSAAQAVHAGMAPMAAAMTAMRPFTVNGSTYGPQQLVGLLVTDPGNLDVHVAQCPAWVAFWGVLSADAKREHDKRQADYRMARDKWASARRKESKVTKDALDEEWRCLAAYPQWYEGLRDAEYAWSCAQFVYEACTRKVQMLSSLARMYADERSATAPSRPPYQARL